MNFDSFPLTFFLFTIIVLFAIFSCTALHHTATNPVHHIVSPKTKLAHVTEEMFVNNYSVEIMFPADRDNGTAVIGLYRLSILCACLHIKFHLEVGERRGRSFCVAIVMALIWLCGAIQ